jgi:hypothetical protein
MHAMRRVCNPALTPTRGRAGHYRNPNQNSLQRCNTNNITMTTVTKSIAMRAPYGRIFYHQTLKQGPKGHRTALRVRVSGKCKTWVRRATEFRLPVKFGLYESWAITHENCHEWLTSDPTK